METIRKKYKRFSKSEENYIRENHKKLSVIEIGRNLNRSTASIRIKMNINMHIEGINEISKISEDEIEFVRNNYIHKSNKELSEKMNISQRRVVAIMLKADLRRKFNYNSNEKDEVRCPICKNFLQKTEDNFYFTKEGKLHSTNCKKCASIKSKMWSSKDYHNYIKRLLSGIKSDIKRRNKSGCETNLDIEFLIEKYKEQKGKCAITGIEMSFSANGERDMSTISIDRIDNTIGYLKDNIQLVCRWANIAKSTLSCKEFKEFVNLTFINLNRKNSESLN